jgi:hypothetical protein
MREPGWRWARRSMPDRPTWATWARRESPTSPRSATRQRRGATAGPRRAGRGGRGRRRAPGAAAAAPRRAAADLRGARPRGAAGRAGSGGLRSRWGARAAGGFESSGRGRDRERRGRSDRDPVAAARSVDVSCSANCRGVSIAVVSHRPDAHSLRERPLRIRRLTCEWTSPATPSTNRTIPTMPTATPRVRIRMPLPTTRDPTQNQPVRPNFSGIGVVTFLRVIAWVKRRRASRLGFPQPPMFGNRLRDKYAPTKAMTATTIRSRAYNSCPVSWIPASSQHLSGMSTACVFLRHAGGGRHDRAIKDLERRIPIPKATRGGPSAPRTSPRGRASRRDPRQRRMGA